VHLSGIPLQNFDALTLQLNRITSLEDLEACLKDSVWAECRIYPLFVRVARPDTAKDLISLAITPKDESPGLANATERRDVYFSMQDGTQGVFVYSTEPECGGPFLELYLRTILATTIARVFQYPIEEALAHPNIPAINNRYEAEIEKLKNYYYKLLNDIPGQIAVFDKDLKYRFINPESVKEEALREWLIGKDDLEYCQHRGIDPVVGQTRQTQLHQALREKRRLSFFETIPRPGGEILYFFRVISPIFDKQGDVEYLIGYGVDITQQKRAEQERDRFFNLSLDFLCIAGTDGYLKRINPALEQTLGYTTEDLLASPILAFVYEEDLEMTSQFLQDLAHGKIVRNFEIRFRCRNNDIKWISWKANKVPDIQLIYMVGRDITEQKWVEQELINAKTLAEESTKAKEEFLAHMSHEIRTPLNAIIGMTDLIIENRTPEKNANYLRNIKTAADNLSVLISDILDFSKINSGKIELEYQPFSLIEIITRTVQILELWVNEKGLKLSFTIAPDIPSVLIGDPQRISQIATNFLTNAVKFTEQGEVTIFASLTGMHEDEAEIVIGVTDTGIGIPAEKLDHIFESFAQVRSSGYILQQGAGLGLTITKKMAEMHNGRVEVESELGKGSTFRAYLRLKIGGELDAQDTADNSVMDAASPLKGVSVLVVEDNELNQIVVSNLLENWGATYAIAKHGQEAISYLEAARFQIVLMDLAMPVMDGFQATEFIRTKMASQVNSIPIIALTASAVLDVRKRTLAAGMNDYVPKPFKAKELLQKLLLNLKYPAGAGTVEIAPEEHDTETILDLAYLREVSAHNDELLLRMLNEAQKNFLEFFAGAEEFIAESNYQKIKYITHKIKPVCRYIGSDRMFAEVSALERSAKAEESVSIMSGHYKKFHDAWSVSGKQLGEVMNELRTKLQSIKK
jgi:PAS domain S-box-containing protein